MPAVMYSAVMDWAKELAVIPKPLRIPPRMTTGRQPYSSTRTLHNGPTKAGWNTEHGTQS